MSSYSHSVHSTFRTRRTRVKENTQVIVRGQGLEKGSTAKRQEAPFFAVVEMFNILIAMITQFYAMIIHVSEII